MIKCIIWYIGLDIAAKIINNLPVVWSETYDVIMVYDNDVLSSISISASILLLSE